MFLSFSMLYSNVALRMIGILKSLYHIFNYYMKTVHYILIYGMNMGMYGSAERRIQNPVKHLRWNYLQNSGLKPLINFEKSCVWVLNLQALNGSKS